MSPALEYRAGTGWDVHRLVAGRPLILGGVKIDSPIGLDGHSDADVLSHAITDALLGAASQGDIGMHFPDSEPRWKNADSLQMLHHAVQVLRLSGYHVVHVDSTVVLESPKLKDYRGAIRQKLAETLGLRIDRVSVKFKTAEKIGPVGEGRAAEAHAVATVSRRAG